MKLQYRVVKHTEIEQKKKQKAKLHTLFCNLLLRKLINLRCISHDSSKSNSQEATSMQASFRKEEGKLKQKTTPSIGLFWRFLKIKFARSFCRVLLQLQKSESHGCWFHPKNWCKLIRKTRF